MQTTISLAKLACANVNETDRFIKQIATHGWCRMNELTTTPSIKPTESTIRQFFEKCFNQKRTYSNSERNIGYIWSSTNERVRVLTGKIYEHISANESTLGSDIINNTLCNNMNEIALQIFHMICKHIIKQDWIKISSQNEICLTRNYFYSYRISVFISSNWSQHQFICDDITLLISKYYAAENKQTFNYGMFEAIQYNKPLKLNNGLFCVDQHFDIGFCAIGIGETCEGLQLFDRIQNKYINADFSNCIYIWIGAKIYELCNGAIPTGLHRVRWYNKKRISYLYEICIGQQIQSISFANNENIKKPYKCLRKIISPIIQQNELLRHVIVKQATMTIFVKSLNGRKAPMTVDVDATVKAVKRELEEQQGIPCERLRIIFKGKLLNDTDVLSNKGILPGMTLHSAIMLRGY